MIERMLDRFRGAFSYEEGIRTLTFGRAKTNGVDSISFQAIDVTTTPVPILVTLKNRKQKIPYEDEAEFHFEIEYINQNDDTHVGYCVIPVYAEADLDFRVIMQETTDFVKEITGINPRTGYETILGDVNDTIEIIGLIGNIAKLQAVKALMISDVFYNIRVASLQRFVEMAYKSGLNYLSTDYGVNISSSIDTNRLRLLTRLFSTFVIPAKSIMQESMNVIISVIDPNGSVIVTADYDNPYKMIVNYYPAIVTIDANDLEIIKLFAYRYRPVPADIDINFVFDDGMEESAKITEEGVAIITGNATLFSLSTIFSNSTLFNSGIDTILTLPDDYP